MKITYPHMGNVCIVIKALLTDLGLELVLPPPTSRRTVELGVRYSHEFACFPFKLNMGNYLEAYELGADTILMAGGVGPCRFGYYAQVQQQILEDLGVKMEMVVLEPPDVSFHEVKDKILYLIGNISWWQVFKAVRFAWSKARAIDTIEEKLLYFRPRVKEPIKLEGYFRETLKEIDEAADRREVERVVNSFLKKSEIMPQLSVKPLKVGLVGEIFTLLEPFANYDMERRLGLLGVEVTRSVWLSAWINEHLCRGLLRVRTECSDDKKLAAPYLNSFVGGHGVETVGCTVGFAQRNYDGVIQLAPLTCMPEIVAHSVFPAVSEDYQIPLLTFYLDELSGEAGLQTRLEAFVDLISAYSRKKEGVL
ncbi:MAG: CoA protein activase [Syntrophaceticus sp.]|nr:CoA protein activase [Syntrophaceticus sp.]MDD4359737.1 CoA protein activase [Syntrophaceticus sp.]